MADLVERLRAYDPKASLVDRLREHDLSSYPEDGDWQDHYCDRADDLLKEAAAALEAEASKGVRRGLERVTADALALSCDDQFALAKNLASNIGYDLTEEPLHPDTPKPGAFEAMVERALIPEAPVREAE